jgi:hypothetical protein
MHAKAANIYGLDSYLRSYYTIFINSISSTKHERQQCNLETGK